MAAERSEEHNPPINIRQTNNTPLSHQIAVPILRPRTVYISDRIMGKVNEAKVRLWPSLSDVLRVDGLIGFLVIFAKFLASITFMTVSFWSFFIFLGIVSVAPSLFFIVATLVMSSSTPLIIVVTLCFLLEYILPDSPKWAPILLTALVYPMSPTMSVGVCFGLMGCGFVFPMVYIVTVFVYLAPFNLFSLVVSGRSTSSIPQSSWSITLFLISLPAIIPNFMIMWGVALPISIMSVLIWIPLIVAQTYLFLFPCLCLVMLSKTVSVAHLLAAIRESLSQKFHQWK